MGELIKSEGTGLVSLLHGKGGKMDIPKPFERDIFLFDTHIAGTSYIEGIEELEPHLNIDDKLDFFREPDNPHDNRAIAIKNADGVKIG
ncbi:MAG TPA: restriction endonuclease, partial [Ruminococcaceae bacterium]|nr:restriction endonuclease [Syntrophomonas sp.]HCA28687.1 restriction endonuclease [Oscillospiraceae bacterium]